MTATDTQSSHNEVHSHDSSSTTNHDISSPDFTIKKELSPEELRSRLNQIDDNQDVNSHSHSHHYSYSDDNSNEGDSPRHTIPHRRSSVATRNTNMSSSGLNFGKLPSSIPPPIPESLPTTPGYELSQRMFENSLIPPNLNRYPTQQRPTLNGDPIGSNSNTPLLINESNSHIMSVNNPPRNLYRVIATCTWTFVVGMTDGVLGSLLPHIEEYYKISYAIVSLLWLGNAIGYILVAFTAHHLDNYLGRTKMATLSCICFTIMYAIASSGTKFPIMVIAWFFGGIGGGAGLSQFNIFLSKLHNSSKFLGLFHGTYGLGAFLAPLIGTVMVDKSIKWHFFYLILLGVEILNIFFVTLSFKGCEEDLKRWEHVDTAAATDDNYHDGDNNSNNNITPPISIESPPRRSSDVEMDYITSKKSKQRDGSTDITTTTSLQNNNDEIEEIVEEKHDFKAAFKDYRTWLTCAFIFFYQGSEVSMGGWIVTFLLDYRGGNPSSTGYVSSGFWAGITLGRFLLTSILSTNFGVRRSIMVLSIFITMFDLFAWLVPNTIASAIFVSLIGLCIGPIYPMMVSLLTRILPRKIRFCALVLGTAFGSSGGSAVPFAVGMVSEFVGTYVLHPIFLACYLAMVSSWILMPNIERKGAQRTLWQKFW